MKPRAKARRQVFVLTPDEKRASACVLGAFLLGLATMHYRATHPRTPPTPTVSKQDQVKRASEKGRPQRSTATLRSPASAQSESPAPEENIEDE